MKIATYFLFGLYTLSAAGYAEPNPTQDARVQKVYTAFENQPLWIKSGALTACGQQFLGAIKHAGSEGLWAGDYTPLVKAIENSTLSDSASQQKADALLTLGVLNYISDMKGERLNPQAADKTIHLKQVAIDEADYLIKYLKESATCDWIATLSPSSSDYQKLKALLASYREKQAQGGWPKLPKGTKLKLGDRGPNVETLCAQLAAQDCLDVKGDVFDEAVAQGLKKFQRLHGLESDGTVGPATLEVLNTPVENRIQAILVSLERLRWLPTPLPQRYLQVNIPGFYLRAVEHGRPAFDMPIITGKKYTKTPVFTARMDEIIFNPAWHVPASIVHEILPKMQRNPGAYARKGYRVYENPFRIVQAPGPANSLGKIRFTVKSPFSIYLHGTPNQNLFSKANRFFSHGCIRVEDPEKLAFFVFNDPEEWPLSRIKKEDAGSSTKRVPLKQHLPVFITYFTVFADLHGEMHLVVDEYGQDKKLWEAMKSARRYE